MLETQKITKDVKTLLTHHLILQICEHILKYKGKEKNVIYFSNTIPPNLQLLKYFSESDLLKVFAKIILQIKKILPIRVHYNHATFKEITTHKSGHKQELIASIRQTLESTDLSKFSFSKVYYFTKNNNLTFLNKEYFNSIKAKQLLIA